MRLCPLSRPRSQADFSATLLVDFGIGEVVPYDKLLAELLELIDEDADHFGCTAEVERARGILADGTSAHRQLAIWREAQAAGADPAAALRSVVDWLAEETVAGT